MSNVNEPEGALKLAATMLRDQIRTGEMVRGMLSELSALFGITIALADLLNEHGNGDGEVVLSEGDASLTVAEHLANLRQMLVTHRELDETLAEQLSSAQMLYDRFLERYAMEPDDD